MNAGDPTNLPAEFLSATGVAKPIEPIAPPRMVSKWGQDRRLEFIDWRLRWEGRINRSDLTSFFGISVPQASLDIARYLDLAPLNAVYDRSNRVYLTGNKFAPFFEATNSERFLNELLARSTGVLQHELGYSGWTPPTDLPPNPARSVPAPVLLTLLRAIREAVRVDVLYQSISSTEPVNRQVSPHALGFDGFRWHVRAYCHRRNAFLDFVVARMLEVSVANEPAQDAAGDDAWHLQVEVVLGPNPALPEAARQVIEMDYGMSNGSVAIRSRQALLFYTLKRLGLLPGQEAPPEVQQIVLINRDAVQSLLPALPQLSNKDAD